MSRPSTADPHHAQHRDRPGDDKSLPAPPPEDEAEGIAYDDEDDFDDEDEDEGIPSHVRLPSAPPTMDLALPESSLDLTTTFESILETYKGRSGDDAETDRVQKRQSNVMKLAEQNEKLKAELRAMTERLEAAERKQKELAERRAAREGGGGGGGGRSDGS